MRQTQNLSVVAVVDDDLDIGESARVALADDFDVIVLESPQALYAEIKRRTIDVVLLDMNFSPNAYDGREGLSALRDIRRFDPTISVICFTAYSEVQLAVTALKQGAVDFLEKPWKQNQRLLSSVSVGVNMAHQVRKSSRLQLLNEELSAVLSPTSPEIIGSSPGLRKAFEILTLAAPTSANILILGETGVGKELFARELHKRSDRRDKPFIAIDVGSIPKELFESELFGHKRGAFTGASTDRLGRVQAAAGGTLFLDEIGNLPLDLQSKLLRVLAEREIIPLGAVKPIPVDIRVVCATNRSIQQLLVVDGFRTDLLFRIKTIEVILPPLRDRKEDIATIAEHFLAYFARKHKKSPKRLSSDARARLEAYTWPGNIRELKHAIERVVVLSSREVLGAHDFSFDYDAGPSSTPDDGSLKQAERRTIADALECSGGNVSRAAARLGITRQMLYRRMRAYGLT